jgi:hypothetical protein
VCLGITLTLQEYGSLAKEHEDNGFAWTKELQEQAEKRFNRLSAQGPGLALGQCWDVLEQDIGLLVTSVSSNG